MAVAMLRSAFGSLNRTWVTGWVIGAAMVAVTALIETVVMADDVWQYLATFLLGYAIVVAWTVAGALVGTAALMRRRAPAVETVVHVLLGVTIVIAVVMWTWLAVTSIAVYPY